MTEYLPNGRPVPQKKKRRDPYVEKAVKQLFGYYSPTGRPQPKGLRTRAASVVASTPRVVIDKLLEQGGKMVFVHQKDVEERRPIPKAIQKLIGGMDLGILGDVANMYAPASSIDSHRPMIFVSTNPTGPKSFKLVARHELGHSASADLYLRRMLGTLYRGAERKTPGMMPGQTRAVANSRDQETMGPGWSVSLGHNDTTFPADKFPSPKRWGNNLKDAPEEFVNEEKWAESFAYYTDKRWRKRLHPDLQQYFRDTLGE